MMQSPLQQNSAPEQDKDRKPTSPQQTEAEKKAEADKQEKNAGSKS
jgi:hypothetical protein